MAFSLRKMLSNITYFTKPEDECSLSTHEDDVKQPQQPVSALISTSSVSFERTEPDSTSKQCATSLKLPVSVKKYTEKKVSLSDTDLQEVRLETPPKKDRKKCKKLKLNIKTASQSDYNQSDQSDSSNSNNIENTPKHILLDRDSADFLSKRFQGFDFDRATKLFENMSGDEDEFDIQSIELSDHSDTDISLLSDAGKETIKMCRKVSRDSDSGDNILPHSRSDTLDSFGDIELNQEETIKMCRKVNRDSASGEGIQLRPRSGTPDSFGDVELERNEEERISLLLDYQMKLEKLECFLKKILMEFQFHIEVSKVFLCKSVVTTLPQTDSSNIPKVLCEVTYSDNIKSITPDPWSIVMEKEDTVTKYKVRSQLFSMKKSIEKFINEHLSHDEPKNILRQRKSITSTRSVLQKRRVSNKKKYKHFDFPDLREAFINLFSDKRDTNLSECESDNIRCECRCHEQHSPSSETDSGLSNKGDRSISNYSISTSIGNFTLNSSTLSAYSESLDQTISYNSFQDTSLYGTMLQKLAIERITFYVQVHSIQLNCVTSEAEFESKSVITFYCPACKATELDENGLLKHILSQSHCEKIHFLYKTAYIKKCMSSGKEIMPSTVLNPMKMYRDVNKIVCFGDAMYACSLCFENLIVGESVLMAHIAELDHVERRERLCEILG